MAKTEKKLRIDRPTDQTTKRLFATEREQTHTRGTSGGLVKQDINHDRRGKSTKEQEKESHFMEADPAVVGNEVRPVPRETRWD